MECVRTAQDGFSVTIAPPTRSLAENALLHALIGHLSKTRDWAGQKRDKDTWKRMLVAAWCRATDQPMELLPALDGYGVDIVYAKTSKLSVKDCAELIDYVYAWGAQNGIAFDGVDA